jgi:predicted DNA-binding WGR domain protein
MTRREFEFAEGNSNKFWTVWVEGTTMHVHFGKIGTNGQKQQKEFGSEAEANAAAQKLITEKTKKGYTEVKSTTSTTEPTSAPPPATKAAPAPKTPAAPVAPSPAPLFTVTVERKMSLTPADERRAGLSAPEPVPARSARPFDAEACKQHIVDHQHTAGMLATLPDAGADEAVFWLLALEKFYGPYGPDDCVRMVQRMKAKEAQARPTLSQLKKTFDGFHYWQINEQLLKLQAVWMSPGDWVELVLCNQWATFDAENLLTLTDWVAAEYWPHRSEADRQKILQKLRQALASSNVLEGVAAAFVGRHLGLGAEVRAFLEGLKKNALNADALSRGLAGVVFSLHDKQVALTQARRLGLRFPRVADLRAWLALTGHDGLDIVRDSILGVRKAAEQLKLLEVLLAVESPEAAMALLETRLGIKPPEAIAPIDGWFRAHAEHARIGLDSLRDEASPRGEAVRRILGSLIPAAGATPGSPATASTAPVPPSSTPGDTSWLTNALASIKKPKNLPAYVDPAKLPPLHGLAGPDLARFLTALIESTLAAAHPAVSAMRTHGERAAKAAFAWALFEMWLANGTPSKDKWLLTSLGYLGDDGCVMKLAPMIRAWPGESQHQRAVTGLEILRTIGTDVALMQLNGMALKLKFKALQDRARQLMDLIAQDRGLTRDQLEDRIVPDLGLQADGSRTLDFGPRQFRIVFESDLSPTVADESGKMLKDLPKPGAKDDAAQASEAAEFWKAFKKQWREALKIQLTRLEQAMVTGRTWSRDEWQTLLAQHPLMQHLVRRLVWQQGETFFRVDAQGRPVSHDGTMMTLAPNEPIRVAHQLHLSEGQLQSWRAALLAAEVVTPFEQLDRRVFMATANEGTALPVPQEPIAGVTLRSKLEDRGWRRLMHDQGGITGFSKVFPQAGVTAVVFTQDTLVIGMVDETPNGIEEGFFVAGINHPYGSCSDEFTVNLARIPTVQVDRVAYSETVRELMDLAPRGKQ